MSYEIRLSDNVKGGIGVSETMETTIQRMAVQLKSLDVQIEVLKALMERTQTEVANKAKQSTTRSFASLYGILKGQCESNEEDIAAVEYRLEKTFLEKIT